MVLCGQNSALVIVSNLCALALRQNYYVVFRCSSKKAVDICKAQHTDFQKSPAYRRNEPDISTDKKGER